MCHDRPASFVRFIFQSDRFCKSFTYSILPCNSVSIILNFLKFSEDLVENSSEDQQWCKFVYTAFLASSCAHSYGFFCNVLQQLLSLPLNLVANICIKSWCRGMKPFVFGTGCNDFQTNVERQPGNDQWRPLEIKTYQGLPLSWINRKRKTLERGCERGEWESQTASLPNMFTSYSSPALLLKLP